MMREEAMHLRDDARKRFRSTWERASEEPGGQERGARPEGGGQQRGARDWGSWLGWGDWGNWGDWPGRKSWPGPRDVGAFHDLERLARDFATDLRKVAWDSGALGGDVLGTLRDILEDTLDRIRTEVFAPGDKPPGDKPPGENAEAPAPSAESERRASPEKPAD